MIQLTQEEWAQVAGRIGDAAQDLEEVHREYKEEEEEHEELLEYRKLVHDMRLTEKIAVMEHLIALVEKEGTEDE